MEIGAHASAPAPSRRRGRGAGVRRGERFGSGQPSNAGGSAPSEPGGVSTKGRSCTPPRSRCGLHGRPRGGALVGRPRCTRIFRAAAWSSTMAMSSMRLAHFGPRRASIPQLRRRSVAHSRRRARVGSSGPRGSRASRAGSPGAERPGGATVACIGGPDSASGRTATGSGPRLTIVVWSVDPVVESRSGAVHTFALAPAVDYPGRIGAQPEPH